MNEENLSKIPEGWTWAYLADLTSEKITKGSTPTSYGFSYKEEGINFIRTENIDEHGNIRKINTFIDDEANKYLKRSILHKKDILFSIAGTIGRVGIVKEKDLPANTNQALGIIRCHWNYVDNLYMFYLLRSQLIQRSIFNSIVGVGRANVSLTNLKDLIIPFPPLNEQKRIVFKIEELLTKVDAGIRELKQAKKQLKILRHSVLKFAFEGKFTAEWRNVNKHDIESASELLERVKEKKKKITKNYKELSVEISKYDLPEEWELTNFESIIEDKLIGFVKAMKYQNNQGIGIPYVKMNNITIEGKLDLDDIVYVEANKEEIKKYTLNKGDILFNTRNSYELVGKTAIVTDDNHLRIFNNNIMRIRPFKDINPFFISYQLNSDHFKDYIMHEKKATTNICALYSKDIMPAPIIIPPFEEQEKIVEEIETQFSKIDKTEKNIDITLIQAQRLRKSVLIKAFEGELVPQDHTDESAKKILEHIKEQK